MSLLPQYKEGSIEDGKYIHALPFCKRNCASEKCSKFYNELAGRESGSYCCPYGLSAIVHTAGTSKYFFTGLKIRGVYDKKKSKAVNSSECIYNPVISEDACLAIAQDVVSTLVEKEALQSKLEAINDLLHETRTLNGQTKNTIDQLLDAFPNEEEIDYDALLTALKNAHVSSYMIYNRFSYFDSVLNPSLSVGIPYSANIFKKFDKMRKLLKGYLHKNVWISLQSDIQSDFRYNILPTFEILLFIILENAIKYSPQNKPVNVSFEQAGNNLDITIESIGPFCDENELLHLCEKGFRGENAKALQRSGQGFGLSFAQKICNQHGITLSFESKYSNKDHGIKYGFFKVRMHFEAEQSN